jgi:uncharacterized protein (DUF488 family)
MTLYTIGFTKKSAREFFGILKEHGIVRLIDIRESNTNIYAGFTMRESLRYFLKEICNADYVEMKEFAPTRELRRSYQERGDWNAYGEEYLALLKDRKVEKTLDKGVFRNAVLLCSEPTPEKCHRRLAAEYIAGHVSETMIVHL